MSVEIPAPGGKIVDSAPFRVVRIAVLTISDTRDEESDTSGKVLADRVAREGHDLAGRAMVKDDVAAIRAQMQIWIDDPSVDAIVSTGGTGLTGRDVTPEAVRPLLDKEIDGFNVVWHLVSYQSVGLSTLQSRACAGVAKSTFYFLSAGLKRRLQGWLGQDHPLAIG